jgi:hypothetical protein
LVLTFPDPTIAGGKSSADTEIVEARYVDSVQNGRVVQAVDFVSDARRLPGR